MVQAASCSPSDSFASIDVQPLSVHIGAEIGNVDLTGPLEPAVVTEIRAALLRWKVVFFHGQRLNHEQHIRFARYFGELTPAHVVHGGDETYPAMYSVGKKRPANSATGERLIRPWSGWHTDITAAINPPACSILRGDIVPPYGGDTQWTSLMAAYQGLSPTLRAFVDGLRAVHRYDAFDAGANMSREYNEQVKRRPLVSEHPLVRVHPETGERALYVSPGFIEYIVGLNPRESQQLLELLWEQLIRPEYTVRFRWEDDCVAFWDNRSTAHLAPKDIFDVDFDRQFYRVTTHGDVPVGVDDTASKSIEGEPIPTV